MATVVEGAEEHVEGTSPPRRVLWKLCLLGSRARNKLYTLILATGLRERGSRTTIVPPCRIRGAERISLGAGVFVGGGCWLEVLGSQARLGGGIKIGDGTSMAGRCTITAAAEVVLESKVLLAGNVYISDHTHAFQDPAIAILDQGVTGVRPVRICSGAWLGQNVVVCPGVRIGCGSVVGANSVVKQDVPDFSMAVGAPARVIKRLNRRTGDWERV